MEVASVRSEPLRVGRYLLWKVLASGGMGSVHLGRLLGSVGFHRTVAVKRLHPHLATEGEFVKAFVDEARLASRVHHPNVVQTLDVVAEGGEVFLVMEFVLGEVLSKLSAEAIRAAKPLPRSIALGVMSHVLQGLHAAHEAKDERGQPLRIIHRDVSPQNVILGADGVARVLDFGVAKAEGRLQTTSEGKVKGKFAYMAPEHLSGTPLEPSADVYSASVVLWELLTGQRMFSGADPSQIVFLVAQGAVRRPSRLIDDLPSGIEDIVMQGLERQPDKRFQSAKEMALALEQVERGASPMELAEWLSQIAGPSLKEQRQVIAEMESGTEARASLIDIPMPVDPPRTPVEATEVHAERTESTAVTVPAVPQRSRRTLVTVGVALAALLGVRGAVSLSSRGRPQAPVAAAATSSPSAAPVETVPVSTVTAVPPPTTQAASASASAPAAGVAPATSHRPAFVGKAPGQAAPKPSGTKRGDGLFEWN